MRISSMNHIWSVVQTSYSRLAVGCLVLLLAVILLVWNETNAVQMTRSLDEGQHLVVPLASADAVAAEHDGKVVHVSGELVTSPPLRDLLYGVEIDAVRLKRRVQMYQWIEDPNEGLDVEISPGDASPLRPPAPSYSTAWKDKLVDSGLFSVPYGHDNPTSFPLQSEIQTAETVKIGNYLLSSEILETFTKFEPFSGDEEPSGGDVKLHAGMYYHTSDIFSPRVGDLRVQFYYAGHASTSYSIVGTLEGSTIKPYRSSGGQELVLLQEGTQGADAVLATHHKRASRAAWGLRLVAFTLLCAAVALLLPLLQVLACACGLPRDTGGGSGGRLTVSLAATLNLAVVAGCWCLDRPLLALMLGVLALYPPVKWGW
ncbi:transmembrane protein 43 homolog [Hyalella azteca]|uniref:Transmembrane protein 43 homolog n=1 Tax=Hyalella azteca TaxID=294128 RepID=A0A8B7P8Z2_HYAAZ|nr:transmembrane protein 43 homolog [Hyalella azteca]